MEESYGMFHRAAKHIELSGKVQGVGFCPFVRNLATEHHLVGWVRHRGADVEIEAEGPSRDLDAFLAELASRAPSRATIDKIRVQDSPTSTKGHFLILQSVSRPDP
jgi:hydrogenase maturation protein HypF